MYKLTYLICSILLLGCKSQVLVPVVHYPEVFDTSDRPIAIQEICVFEDDSVVFADNQFAGARLNGFERINDSSFLVKIRPENMPINPSPWYAFRLWSARDAVINLYFDYGTFRHRYYPRLSKDGKHWANADSSKVHMTEEGRFGYLKLVLSTNDTIWVAGQDVITSSDVYAWARRLAEKHHVSFRTIGQSKLGRDLVALDIDYAPGAGNPLFVVLGRQHPPEVTGYKAMQAFVQEILNGDSLSEAFLQKARVLVLPMLNPDGVDMGHWRHGAGGVDLNRDWAAYHQPEIDQAAAFIFAEGSANEVVMGIDFHSTYDDVFYTNDTLTLYPTLKTGWFAYMESEISAYRVNEKSSPVTRPVSKSWFFSMYGVEGVTYEVGDSTPEELIELKGRISAQGIMKTYLQHYTGPD